MSILVLGSHGLLGSHLCALYPKLVVGVSRKECDITSMKDLVNTFEKYKPEFVVNCAGVVPKAQDDPMTLFRVNSLAPRMILEACEEYDARLVHVSSDCVFSGDLGGYLEDQLPNPQNLYGLSKALGEVFTDDHTTIRASFVGYPDPNGRGLFSWLSQQETAYGWTKFIWNGVTSVDLAQHIMVNIIYNEDYGGLQHYFSATTQSKCDLLERASKAFGWNVNIIPVDEPQENRTLATHGPTEYMRDFDEMLEEMVGRQAELERCVYATAG